MILKTIIAISLFHRAVPFKGIDIVAIDNIWSESIPFADSSVEKEVHRFMRVDMLAHYLVSMSSSVVRPVYCEVLIAIHAVDVFHYFESLD